MARPRSDTATLTREGHSVSLKVLRLSRPSLSLQHPLPHSNTAGIHHSASLAFPSLNTDQDFILSTNLALPPSFGSAYVGETFACSLCANNELPVLPPSDLADKNVTTTPPAKSVSSIRITAEMQTPSQTLPVQLHSVQTLAQTRNQDDDDDDDTLSPGQKPTPTPPPPITTSFDHSPTSPGTSLQRILRFDLKEEGNHVLAVNVSYTELAAAAAAPSSSRIRTFRKLYQFQSTPLLSVRTKATDLPARQVADVSPGNPYGRSTLLRYTLEAQLENVSEERVVLEQAVLKPVPPFRATSLNLDRNDDDDDEDDEDDGRSALSLSPRDILQVAFLVEQEHGVADGLEELRANLKRDGRTVLGQIGIQWRGTMGEKGWLSTGNLLTRKKQ